MGFAVRPAQGPLLLGLVVVVVVVGIMPEVVAGGSQQYLRRPPANISGQIGWTNASLIETRDGRGARAAVNMTTSNETASLFIGGFAFAVPPGATVDGIVVRVWERGSTAVRPTSVRIRNGAASSGNPLSEKCPCSDQNRASTLNFTSRTYGGANDTWGIAGDLAPSMVNNATFGVVLAYGAAGPANGTRHVLVDYVEMTVFFTVRLSLCCSPLSFFCFVFVLELTPFPRRRC
jgi:hypothetical protein